MYPKQCVKVLQEIANMTNCAVDIIKKYKNDKQYKTYVTKVYSNVKSFEATSCSLAANELILEGLIKFNSGNEKTTTFRFESTTEGLEVNSRGGIIVNEDGLSSRNAVYAGGDVVTGAATVISAMGAGKTAAKAIDEYLSK